MASCPAAVPLTEWLREQARRSGIPALVGFAGTLHTIERRGRGHEELYTLAQQVTNAYLAGVQRRVKQLGDPEPDSELSHQPTNFLHVGSNSID